MVASNSAKHRMDRIIRLHEEIDQIKKDIRDIYAEEKAEGGDKTAMGEAITKIRKRAKDKNAFDEREVMTDVYLSAYDAPTGTRVATHTYAPETSTNPRLIKQVVDGMQTEAGRAALIAAVDIMIEREEAEETHERPSTSDEPSPEAGPQAEASPAGTGTGMLADREGRSNGEAVSADLPTHSDQPLTGGDEDPRAVGEPTSKTGEGAASALPAKPKFHLRPNCLDRSNCKSGSVDHCWSCRKNMEVAAHG